MGSPRSCTGTAAEDFPGKTLYPFAGKASFCRIVVKIALDQNDRRSFVAAAARQIAKAAEQICELPGRRAQGQIGSA